jgi:hypothetical protein
MRGRFVREISGLQPAREAWWCFEGAYASIGAFFVRGCRSGVLR